MFSNPNVMNLAPLLLACRIAKLVRTSLVPDVLRNLLPRNLRRFIRRHAQGQGAVGVWCLGVDTDSVAKKSDLLMEMKISFIFLRSEVISFQNEAHTSLFCHFGFRTR